MRAVLVSLVLAVFGGSLVSCASSGSSDDEVQVVGSFYPLAWAAEQIGGVRVDVLDLTPPGVEAHDTNLSARQVAQVQSADVVLLLGYLGFQPQVEAAARDASEDVVQVDKGMALRPSEERGLSADPHVWLDPVLMERIVRTVSGALIHSDRAGRGGYERHTATVLQRLGRLDASYRSGLRDCGFETFVTTHEAFGYLADRYGLHQIGIEGLTPEAEPSASQIRAAGAAIREGRASPAVFYEGTAEGERIGRSVASTVGVAARPLGTLEFDPAPGTYLSVMRDNLAELEKGLQCR
jgi:zinc transport system substrate-binding protein